VKWADWYLSHRRKLFWTEKISRVAQTGDQKKRIQLRYQSAVAPSSHACDDANVQGLRPEHTLDE
jgi:hypothetical protein